MNFEFNSSGWPKITGIYAIRGKYNGFHLVGQTIQPMRLRWYQHRSKLRKNIHDNPVLQHAYNKHGEEQFEFILLEECTLSNINDMEIHWIIQLQSDIKIKGWNLRDGGQRNLYSDDLCKLVARGIRNSQKARDAKTLQALKQAKTYRFINPSGELVVVNNLRKYCRDNNLCQSNFWNLAKGRMITCKGWKRYVE